MTAIEQFDRVMRNLVEICHVPAEPWMVAYKADEFVRSHHQEIKPTGVRAPIDFKPTPNEILSRGFDAVGTFSNMFARSVAISILLLLRRKGGELWLGFSRAEVDAVYHERYNPRPYVFAFGYLELYGLVVETSPGLYHVTEAFIERCLAR